MHNTWYNKHIYKTRRHTDPECYYFPSFPLWNLHYPNLRSKNAFSASLVFIFFLNISRETSVFITSNILFHNNTTWYLKLFTHLSYRNCSGCRCWDCLVLYECISSIRSSDIHLRAILQKIFQPPIFKISLKITYLKFHSNLPGVNELKGLTTSHHTCVLSVLHQVIDFPYGTPRTIGRWFMCLDCHHWETTWWCLDMISINDTIVWCECQFASQCSLVITQSIFFLVLYIKADLCSSSVIAALHVMSYYIVS